MTTKTVRIMFYDQHTKSFVVDTVEMEETTENENENTRTEEENKRATLSFSTLL